MNQSEVLESIGQPETARDALKRWDSGQSLFTVEMGGLGPGYEQAIQVLVMEIVRGFVDDPSLMDWNHFSRRVDRIASELDKDNRIGGFSGAQVGVAKNLAYHYLTKGWRATLDECKDRLIQISKTWPHSLILEKKP